MRNHGKIGEYLYTDIVYSRIDLEKWHQFYDETLKIIAYKQLATVTEMDIHGCKCCVIRSADNGNGSWCLTGDMVYGGNLISPIRLDRDIFQPQSKPDNGADILLDQDWKDKDDYLDSPCFSGLFHEDDSFEPPHFSELFGVRTLLRAPHLPLLAIACLAADTFPDAVLVYGSISLEQCQAAQELVQEVLGRKISLPVQYDAEKLIPRIQKIFPDDEMKQYAILNEWFEGDVDTAYGNAVQSNFSFETLWKYHCANLTEDNLNKTTAKWMLMDLPFRPFFELLQSKFSEDRYVEAIGHGLGEAIKKENREKEIANGYVPYDLYIYNYNSYPGLLKWKPGDVIDPEDEEIFVDKVKKILQLAEQAWPAFSLLDAQARFRKINYLNYEHDWFFFYTTQENWEYIYDHIMDDDFIKPYLGLLLSNVSSTENHDFAVIMGWKRELFEYLLGKAREG